ncbi:MULTISPECIES: type II secretion system protein GspL [unclassified Pseudomonas]|uniref:type II secretion system protein GspL n=1 Tax=unclassified Pseudomonas TaxID=196821 RepID=UPI0024473C71|nr:MULTISPECIES: type II secretion system protein GspL [unclassified Pseudomonas]MDH0894120.1 type II secretion system protein GspL [Pseudomonas sp. GD03875]MDH1062875.1 type II secretion system protein GspL [Pseudomonas sp. GD03985]
MSLLTLFLPPGACAGPAADLLVWRVDGDIGSQLPFSEAVPAAARPWRLVLPVEAVTVCAVQLPTTKARWLQKALPFAVEELLADDVEYFHLAVGDQLADGRHRVHVVRRDWLAGWLALCGDNPPQRIEVDADLLTEEGSQLFCLGERWLLGGSGEARLALRGEDWPQLAGLCPSPRVAHVAAGQPAPADIDQCHEHAQPLVWLAGHVAACNLAQGAFARREPSGQWQRWRPLAALLGLWLVLQWGFNLAQGWHLQREGERYAEASRELYRELFPGDSKLINLRAQFDQHLAESEGGGQQQLLQLLDQAASAIGEEGARVQVQQLDFNAQRGNLALNLQASDFATLESLRTRLQQSGLAVDMGSASREGNGVSARLVIGGNG